MAAAGAEGYSTGGWGRSEEKFSLGALSTSAEDDGFKLVTLIRADRSASPNAERTGNQDAER